ncbi:L-lactate dehydrogenase complex protein LldG [Allocatelliglobosispora scoriae]|uniref:L-lactate dehydrogenase complex protein LldG n=1 Tax=Allocatelliglobosispora scoriae TaxID=643052 RepID=A0A841BKV3_9ACTN|nr:lactate utilization protein C [Allocatelliglobosispora scoriae]MBB5867829.1 L-lactate dehydrogenase complex protein LldG [Allocatelliglobosispora scoriae]
MSTPPSARDEILARIRTSLGDRTSTVEIPRDYHRTGGSPVGSPELLELLTDRLVDYKATVHRATPADFAAVLASVLESAGRVVVPAGLPDGWAPPAAVVDDGSLSWAELDAVDTVLTSCTAAAAETGTIVLDGSPDQGRRAVTLIPDRHICVVRADQVVRGVPELLGRLDPRRPLTFISGPSATSDIELQRVEGVHGPRKLIVVLVSD